MLARAAESGLHLVADEHSTGSTHDVDGSLDVTGHRIRQTLVGEERVDEHARHSGTVLLKRPHRIAHLSGISVSELRLGQPESVIAGVGHRHLARKFRELFHDGKARRERRERGGVSVVAEVAHDDPAVARRESGDPQGEFIGFSSRTREHRRVQRCCELRGQALGVLHDGLVQISRVQVQCRGLTGDGVDHMWMAMAHVRHVVVGIQIAAPVDILEPYALTAHEMHRLVVEQRSITAEDVEPTLHQRVVR